MLIYKTLPDDDFIEKLLVDYITSASKRFFVSQNYKESALIYVRSALSFIYSENFDHDEIYGDGELNFMTTHTHYQNISISFIDKIMLEVFGQGYPILTKSVLTKEHETFFYNRGENPFGLESENIIFTDEIFGNVVGFVLYYIHSVGNLTISTKEQ